MALCWWWDVSLAFLCTLSDGHLIINTSDMLFKTLPTWRKCGNVNNFGGLICSFFPHFFRNRRRSSMILKRGWEYNAHVNDSRSSRSFSRMVQPFWWNVSVSVGVSWNGKTGIFFTDSQKTKVDQNCYIYLLKTSLQPECRRLYPGNDFVFNCSCKTVFRHTAQLRKSDATVSTTEHSRLHSCWMLMNGRHILQILSL